MESTREAAVRLTKHLGELVKIYEYRQADGTLSFCNLRILQPDGSKTFRMMSEAGNGFELRRGDLLKPVNGWPLYGLFTLDRPGPVWVVEGEKDADSLHALGLPCVTSGSTSTDVNADWSPLAGREVVLWPDNDDSGKRYVERIGKVIRPLVSDVATIAVEALGLRKGADCSDWLAIHPSAGVKEVSELTKLKMTGTCPQRPDAVTLRNVASVASVAGSKTWPVLHEAALYGIAGEVVRMIEPHSEADPFAVLIQLLAALANLVGPRLHCVADGSRHAFNLFSILVGESSRGRKGTSWSHVQRLISQVDAAWVRDRVTGGLSSAEGLIAEVRDDAEPPLDRRLLVIEPEFASVLKSIDRQGNTLSPLLRCAWDSGNLRTLVKHNPLRATGAYISIVGHITLTELRRYLSESEQHNGFANRLLWCAVRRSKLLPEGGNVPISEMTRLAARFREVLAWAEQKGEFEMRRDEDARALWAVMYPELTADRPGLLGAATARGESQVLRISCIYAILDCSPIVRIQHLQAALAVWDYCFDSANFIFGDASGDSVADCIGEALRVAGINGLTRTAIRDLLSRHVSADRIGQALAKLAAQGLASHEMVSTEGRAIELWRATEATKATEA